MGHVRNSWVALLALVPALSALNVTAQLSRAAVDPSAAQNLLERCDTRPEDDYLDDDELPGYLVSFNEPLFETYDLDCDGALNPEEEAKYYAEERAKATKQLEEAISNVRSRIADTIQEYQGTPVSYEQAEKIPADTELEKLSVGVKFAATRKPVDKEDTLDFSFSAEQKPWRTLRGFVPLSIGLDWSGSLSRDQLTTDESKVTTDELAFTPFSFRSTDSEETVEFEFSAGAGLVRTKELELLTGVSETSRTTTFAYKLGITYTPKKAKCWRLGAAYEVKTERLLSDTVSSTFGPEFEYDLLCGDDEEAESSAPRLTPRGILQTR